MTNRDENCTVDITLLLKIYEQVLINFNIYKIMQVCTLLLNKLTISVKCETFIKNTFLFMEL